MDSKNPRILVAESQEKLLRIAMEQWADVAWQAIQERGDFTVALSGGSSPRAFYRRLADWHQQVIWQKSSIFLVDERCVPFDHADSNFAMIRENLIVGNNVLAEKIYPMDVESLAPRDAAQSYESLLKRHFRLTNNKGVPVFDLLILGLGEDGHTASLFPGMKPEPAPERLVVATGHPSVTHERVSLNFSVLNAARNVLFFAFGERKAATIARVMQGDAELPAARVHPQGRLTFYLDRAAAGRLSGIPITQL